MNDLEYRTTIAVIKTACEREEFEDFMKNGVNKAKSTIVKALSENPAGLPYLKLNSLVAKLFLNEKGRTAVWKTDSFIVAIAGLELEDKKIKHELGVYKLIK